MPKAQATRNTTNQDKYIGSYMASSSRKGGPEAACYSWRRSRNKDQEGKLSAPLSPLLSSREPRIRKIQSKNPKTDEIISKTGAPATFPAPGSKSIGTRERQIKAMLWRVRLAAQGWGLGPFGRGKKKNRIGGRDGLGLWRRVEVRLA